MDIRKHTLEVYKFVLRPIHNHMFKILYAYVLFLSHYDHTYATISECWSGYEWSDKTFLSTIDSVPGEAHLGGLGGDQMGRISVSGKLLNLAHVTVRFCSHDNCFLNRNFFLRPPPKKKSWHFATPPPPPLPDSGGQDLWIHCAHRKK